MDVSVIIPVYNGEAFLRECLDSVLAQTGCDWEILCVNDGSTDGSTAILAEYAKKDARIRVITQENRGVSAARNHALAEARGEFVSFLDCDDLYPAPDVLTKLFRAASAVEADICGGSLSEMYPDGRIETKFTGKRAGLAFSHAGWIKFADFAFEYGFQRFLFRRDFLKTHGIAFPPYSIFEDPVFLIRAMIAAGRFYAISDTVYRYRLRDGKKNYTEKQVRELAAAGVDILRLTAQKPEYRALHDKYTRDFFGDFSEENAVGSRCLDLLLDGDRALAELLLPDGEEEPLAPLKKILGKRKSLPDGAQWDRLLKRFLLKRKIAGFFRCLKENGPAYTFRRLCGKNRRGGL